MRPTRRPPAGALLLALAVCGIEACSSPQELAPRKPYNLVLVSLDTLRADHLGFYGYGRETSPNLDALAKESVVFDFAVAQSSHTSPSHNSLFQSRVVSHLSDGAPMLAEVLRGAGYQTAAFTGGGKVSSKRGFDRGFDTFSEEFNGFSASFPIIEQWLREAVTPPIFLFIHTYDIHLPYDPPPPFDSMFYPEYDGPIQGSETGRLARQLLRVKEFEGSTQEIVLTEADRDQVVALYDGGIRYTDQFVGRLVEALRRQGLWETTVLVVLSDHGEEFWDHGAVSHGLTLYQELIRVPLLMRFPKSRFAGLRVSEMVRMMDVTPTLLEVTDIELRPGMQGRSLLPLLQGREMAAVSAMSEISGFRSLIRFPWKLVERYGEEPLLFNLLEDPAEMMDLAPVHPDVVDDLEAESRAILGSSQVEIEHVNVAPEDIEDEERRKQLEALGYID